MDKIFTRTKIVCTIGPAVHTVEKMVELIHAGMNVARFNFSHGTHADHQKNIESLKKAREQVGAPVAILLDTKGPEIRVGKLANDSIPVKAGMRLRLSQKGDGTGEPAQIPIRTPEVLEIVKPGMQILFDDGYIVTRVIEKNKQEVLVEVENEGILKSEKGVNIPGAQSQLPAMTPEDILDLQFGCSQDIDLVAASFIRSARHILSIKEVLADAGKFDILVIAKIENGEGVDNFDTIAQVADGIMVARGDLGVEMDLALVPKLQKMMIRKCFLAGKPVITATQMLESMIHNPRPTRAEVSDVANAIYDGSSAVMLSAETAVGKYPIEVVRRMKRIIQEAEADNDYRKQFEQRPYRDTHDISSALSLAAVKTAYSAEAKAIIAFTETGNTARLLSRLRPSMPILAWTPNPKVYQQMAAQWGVIPICAPCSHANEALDISIRFGLEKSFLSFGDTVVITVGSPFGKRGSTNMMVVESVGEILVRGHQGKGPITSARVAMVLSPDHQGSLEGCFAVIAYCDSDFLPLLQTASGIILQNRQGDHLSEECVALIANHANIPFLTRGDGAMMTLQEGEEVTLDPHRGLVYKGSPLR